MTYSVNVYDKEGKVVSKVELNWEVFVDEKVNKNLIQELYLLQMANARNAIASTKNRGEVHGSGRKLYRQKGTGNGRAWDKNSPTRRHWWVAFWPSSERNYVKSMNKKTRKLALNWIITLKAKDEELVGLQISDMQPKTKEALSILNNMGLSDKKVLLVMKDKNDWIEKSFRNISWVKYILVDYLNPYDLLNSDKVIFLEDALMCINA